ncbi:uncharacterized MFS-type transporter C09D4.1, partial [Cryptotermes secundus]|uniref:uncharacterized MFS-type transporter C09D4.1 n=1 Tax=Cryptotermes secundus TaxID=105785 RepID=UPI001454BDAA
GGEEFAGQVGLVSVIGGMVGSVIFGIILDKTHKFKETTVAVYGFSALGMLAFTFTLGLGSKILVYITSSFVGYDDQLEYLTETQVRMQVKSNLLKSMKATLNSYALQLLILNGDFLDFHCKIYINGFMFSLRCFLGGCMSVGFELGFEITYPEPEGTTAGIVILGTQILSVFHAMAYSWMVHVTGDFWANTVLTITLLIGTGLTAMIPSDLCRQNDKMPDR